MTKLVSMLLFVMLAAPLGLFAQAPDTVLVPNDNQIGTINNVIQGDTTAAGARVNPNRVYKLARGGYYQLNGALVTTPGSHIRIEGEPAPVSGPDPGMAVIVEGVVTGVYYNFTIDCYGDLTMKNVWMIYATNLGTQNWTYLSFEQDLTKNKQRGVFDNCIFDYVNAVAVVANDTGFTGIFTNCIFRNSVDPGQWWAGRMFCTLNTTSRVDTVWATNCTFANQGFTFQADYTPPKFVYFNHNTFHNISKFAFKYYWMTHLICVNNIFSNCHFTGERYADRISQDPDNLLYGAVLDVDTIPEGTNYNNVAELDRVVYFYNNSNYTQPEFQTFYDTYNAVDSVKTVRQKILAEPEFNDRTIDMFTWHPKMRLDPNYAALDGQDPQFKKPATQMDSILAFLDARYLHGGSVFWGYKPDPNGIWPLSEDFSYTNSTLLTAGMGGHPLGDLYHWFPSQYAAWKAQETVEYNNIINGALGAVTPGQQTIPGTYALEQNYPNPFNPTTDIEYSVPRTGHVTLAVYNTIGQKVTTLFSGVRTAGTYHVTFNAGSLASGVYFYRLEADNGMSMTKKMVLMK